MSPFLQLVTPRATSPVTFHVSAATPVTAAGNTIRLVTAVVVVVVVVEWSRKPAGIIHAFVQPDHACHAETGTAGRRVETRRESGLVGGRRNSFFFQLSEIIRVPLERKRTGVASCPGQGPRASLRTSVPCLRSTWGSPFPRVLFLLTDEAPNERTSMNVGDLIWMYFLSFAEAERSGRTVRISLFREKRRMRQDAPPRRGMHRN